MGHTKINIFSHSMVRSLLTKPKWKYLKEKEISFLQILESVEQTTLTALTEFSSKRQKRKKERERNKKSEKLFVSSTLTFIQWQNERDSCNSFCSFPLLTFLFLFFFLSFLLSFNFSSDKKRKLSNMSQECKKNFSISK